MANYVRENPLAYVKANVSSNVEKAILRLIKLGFINVIILVATTLSCIIIDVTKLYYVAGICSMVLIMVLIMLTKVMDKDYESHNLESAFDYIDSNNEKILEDIRRLENKLGRVSVLTSALMSSGIMMIVVLIITLVNI